MSLAEQVSGVLTGAGLSESSFTVTAEESGGVTVRPTGSDVEEFITSVSTALKSGLPNYSVMVARSITDPNIYVRKRPSSWI